MFSWRLEQHFYIFSEGEEQLLHVTFISDHETPENIRSKCVYRDPAIQVLLQEDFFYLTHSHVASFSQINFRTMKRSSWNISVCQGTAETAFLWRAYYVISLQCHASDAAGAHSWARTQLPVFLTDVFRSFIHFSVGESLHKTLKQVARFFLQIRVFRLYVIVFTIVFDAL